MAKNLVPLYGQCPVCGSPGETRERRPGGNDRCINGHEYPSAKAVYQKGQEPRGEAFLLSKGWEHVMTEAEGCDTWTYPHLLRKNWPEWAQKLHGTQCYWDREEALDLQRQVDGPGMKVDRYQLQHKILLEECTRHRRELSLVIPQWDDMSDTERVRWTMKVMAEYLTLIMAERADNTGQRPRKKRRKSTKHN